MRGYALITAARQQPLVRCESQSIIYYELVSLMKPASSSWLRQPEEMISLLARTSIPLLASYSSYLLE